MDYTQLETETIKKTYTTREKILGPLLKFLAARGVTANHITYFRGLLMLVVLYQLFIRESLVAAAWTYLLLFWGLDTLDGALARYTKTASDKGKFNDVFVDQLSYSLFILGLAYLAVANGLFLFLHVIVAGVTYLLAIIYKNQNEPSDWIIHPEPHLIYTKFIAMASFMLLVIFRINYIDLVIFVLNTWMTALALYYFIALQKTPYKPRS